MKSRRGLCASIAFLLAVPLAALSQVVFGTGDAAVIHAALALGTGLMAGAVFDFKTPRWVAWVGSVATGVLAVVFFLQALAELTHNELLHHVAYDVLGQQLEGWLVGLFMAWCVAVLLVDRQLTMRVLGIVALSTAACATAYGQLLEYRGTSLDAQAPALKILWLMPFLWVLFESKSEVVAGGGAGGAS